MSKSVRPSSVRLAFKGKDAIFDEGKDEDEFAKGSPEGSPTSSREPNQDSLAEASGTMQRIETVRNAVIAIGLFEQVVVALLEQVLSEEDRGGHDVGDACKNLPSLVVLVVVVVLRAPFACSLMG